MLNLDNIVSNNNKNKNNDWPFRMLIIGPSGSGKANTLLHLINNLHPIDKIYLYTKDLHEPKYEYLINKRERAGIKNLNDPKAFIEYSDDMDDVLNNINNYNKNRDKKVLIVFDDMIADIKYNKNFKRIIKELFYRACKINVSNVFIMQSYFGASTFEIQISSCRQKNADAKLTFAELHRQNLCLRRHFFSLFFF